MTAPPKSPNATRWHFVPPSAQALLLALGLMFGWYYLRGTWAGPPAPPPRSAADGVRCELMRAADGQREILTSVVIPVPLESAWAILSNYDEWERLFPTIRRQQSTTVLDENRHHVVSEVSTPLGVLSLDFIVTHEPTAEGGHRAWWDAPTPELPVNQGEMRVSPLPNGDTLFTYSVRKRYRRYPEFLVNNMLLEHQTKLVGTLRERIVESARAP